MVEDYVFVDGLSHAVGFGQGVVTGHEVPDGLVSQITTGLGLSLSGLRSTKCGMNGTKGEETHAFMIWITNGLKNTSL